MNLTGLCKFRLNAQNVKMWKKPYKVEELFLRGVVSFELMRLGYLPITPLDLTPRLFIPRGSRKIFPMSKPKRAHSRKTVTILLSSRTKDIRDEYAAQFRVTHETAMNELLTLGTCISYLVNPLEMTKIFPAAKMLDDLESTLVRESVST